jgi:membrane-bound lytic murein transglycosylase D
VVKALFKFLEARNRVMSSAIPGIRVAVEASPGEWREYRFDKPFRIGRLADNGIVIDNSSVSRVHAEVSYQDGCWRIRDLKSVNGLFCSGQKTPSIALEQTTVLRLGADGPELRFEPEAVAENAAFAQDKRDPALEPYIDHYFSGQNGREPAGHRTQLIRRAFSHVEKRRFRQYRVLAVGLVVLILAAGAMAWHEHTLLLRQRQTAEELFYALKAQDVELANLDGVLARTNNPTANEHLDRFRAARRQMEHSYDAYVATLQLYNPKLTEKQRILLRIARVFGECELDMPAGFEPEIDRYIERWRSSGRLKAAIQTAQENGYTDVIAHQLLARGLPPQFFYLALQESNFNRYAVGPKTRKGFAKGMWQFIPETAVKYNLHLGPLVDQGRPDPQDDRHDFTKATSAAALYLQDLTANDAQASGFLVMACYNWGETQILPLVHTMPANPRDRNFWNLLKKHREEIPQETYDYVFYIASAAVIGENPRLFGFDFDNPLAAAR